MLNKAKRRLKLFGLFNAPLLGFAGPQLLELNSEKTVVKIPLNWRTLRRDLKSMYLGALVMGADVASGLLAFSLQEKFPGKKFSIIFKKIDSDFLKRPESDVVFTCSCGKEVEAMMQKAIDTGQRQSLDVPVIATCPRKLGNEPIAKFVLALTVKAV